MYYIRTCLYTAVGLGLLGSSRDDILDRMLWCMRFDRNEALRAEACEAICQLGVRSDKIVQELQMLVSHDDSELVVRYVSVFAYV